METLGFNTYNVPIFYYLCETFGCSTVLDKFGLKTKLVTTAKRTDEDDDFDLFGEQTEEEKAAAAATAQKNAAKAAPKKKVIDKSTLVIDIKPNSLDTDLKALEKEVRKIEMEGLQWNQAANILPIAYGLNKLQMGCLIIDELIATDDIIERIEQIGLNEQQIKEYQERRETGEDADYEDNIPGWVQSAEIVSFQKL